ncbi:hypothetical protein D3C84_1204680 [compost metagenome]
MPEKTTTSGMILYLLSAIEQIIKIETKTSPTISSKEGPICQVVMANATAVRSSPMG